MGGVHQVYHVPAPARSFVEHADLHKQFLECYGPAFHSHRAGASHIYIMNADGSGLTNISLSNAEFHPADNDYNPSWSPDGTKIAFDSPPTASASREIYVMNVDGSSRIRLTYAGSSAGPAGSDWSYQPSWSPSGAGIVFTSNRDDNYQIYVMNADGSGQTNISNSGECCGYLEQEPSCGSYLLHLLNPDFKNLRGVVSVGVIVATRSLGIK